MRYWNHKTNRGRVVYDRKPHVFKWRDARRITWQIPAPDLFGDPRDIGNLFVTFSNVTAKIAEMGADLFLDALQLYLEAAELAPGLSAIIDIVQILLAFLRRHSDDLAQPTAYSFGFPFVLPEKGSATPQDTRIYDLTAAINAFVGNLILVVCQEEEENGKGKFQV